MDSFPGLPEDIARECLIRVPFSHFSSAASVCKRWKNEIELPEFRRRRIAGGHNQKLTVTTQARQIPIGDFGIFKSSGIPVYRLVVFEPATGEWTELPPIPDFPDGLPMFCQVAAVGSDLVMIGGLDRVTWMASKSVFVYSFVSAKWRRGADMPGVRRSFFGCASDLNQTVFVAGGHDNDKNALRSAMTYDVAKNKWIILSDMEKERDECKIIFHRGKFHVVGGYCSEMQGGFEKSAEAFDVSTWQWDPVREDFLTASVCPRTCVGDGVTLYMCCGSDLVASEGDKWQTVARLPAGLYNIDYVTTWDGKLLVTGSEIFDGPHVIFVLDLDNHTWDKVETPEKYSVHVQSACCLEI